MAELRATVMTSFAPAQAAALAGVPAARIETLARELAATRPSVVVVDEDTKDSTTTAAALLLNGVLSSVGVEGGMLLDVDEPSAFTASEQVARVALAPAPLDGRSHPDVPRMLAVPDAILNGKPYPVELLLLHHSNPVFSKPAGAKW
jgi:anaerobic selenocysteine-containing dehydrogenase